MSLTTTQAAKIAKVSDETIRRWCNHCGLKHGRMGEMYVIPEAGLREFLKTGDRTGYGKEVNQTPIYRQAKIIQAILRIKRNQQKMQEIIAARKPAIILKQGERL